MKRGLVILDPAEVPPGEWGERLATVRADLAAAGVDVGLVYGDVFCSDDINYLTNLCVYWNEGMLAIPAGDGDPVMLTKLSPRVFGWMRLTSTLEEIRSGKTFGALAGELLGERAPGTVGLIGADLWPAAVADEVTAALPGWTVRPLGPLIRDRRARPSASEEALVRTAAAALGASVRTAGRAGLTPAERIGEIEGDLRGDGFLDVRVTTLRAPDATESVQVIGQYRTVWAHIAQVVAGRWGPAVHGVLAAATGAAKAGATEADLVAAAVPAMAELPDDARTDVRWVNQADLATAGEYGGDARLADGAIGAIRVEVVFADGGAAAAAHTVRIGAAGAETLTGTEGAVTR